MTQSAPRLVIEIPLLLLLALLWGSSYLYIKIAVAEIPPFTLIAFRVTIASFFLGTVMIIKGERLPRDQKTWRMLLVQAMFLAIVAWTVLAWGQQFVDAGLASVLNSTAPIFVFFITLMITRHEAVSGLKLFGAVLGVAGVSLIMGVEALNGLGEQLAGQIAVLFAAVLYGCSAIYGKKFSHLSPVVTATGTMLWAAIWLVPASLMIDQPWTLQVSNRAMLAALILAIFCTGGALLLYFRLVVTLGSMGVASQAYLRAGVGVILGVVLLGETISPVVILGLFAAILGVIAINIPARRKARA